MTDPVAVAAREQRDRELHEQLAAHHAAALAELDRLGKKECLGVDCGEVIDADATRCPWCRRSQSLAAGSLTGTRRARRLHIAAGSQS